ncbi:MAG: superoxide dismutase family protein [Gammaproteobacteria bacterium]|nr:superoxide dismutase family protein [Gammaproteobacteria bacterium]
MKRLVLLGLALGLAISSQVYAASVTIPMYLTAPGNQEGNYVGSVVATDTQYGLLLTPKLHNLSPAMSAGVHGFHVHVNPSCADNGMAAGGHLDPKHTDHHYGPYNPNGHLGDLPVLYIDQSGNSNVPVLAPRLKVSDILGHSLMVHAGGDTYSDAPELGGGGSRMACGVIPT